MIKISIPSTIHIHITEHLVTQSEMSKVQFYDIFGSFPNTIAIKLYPLSNKALKSSLVYLLSRNHSEKNFYELFSFAPSHQNAISLLLLSLTNITQWFLNCAILPQKCSASLHELSPFWKLPAIKHHHHCSGGFNFHLLLSLALFNVSESCWGERENSWMEAAWKFHE